jgi:hypothetical protein
MASGCGDRGSLTQSEELSSAWLGLWVPGIQEQLL